MSQGGDEMCTHCDAKDRKARELAAACSLCRYKKYNRGAWPCTECTDGNLFERDPRTCRDGTSEASTTDNRTHMEDCSTCRYDGHLQCPESPCDLCEDGSRWERPEGLPVAGPSADSEGEVWYDSLSTGKRLEAVRPTFRDIYMRLAKDLANRSTCARLKVGCVITSTDFRKVLSVGYNGNATGLPNKCDSEEVGSCGCLHAEENAVINCDSPRYVEKVVFCTHLPCVMCAKRLINLGNVRVVYFDEMYRKQDAIDILTAASVKVVRYVSGKVVAITP